MRSDVLCCVLCAVFCVYVPLCSSAQFLIGHWLLNQHVKSKKELRKTKYNNNNNNNNNTCEMKNTNMKCKILRHGGYDACRNLAKRRLEILHEEAADATGYEFSPITGFVISGIEPSDLLLESS
jgi:hypothetical protein